MRKPGDDEGRVIHYRDAEECLDACEKQGLDYATEEAKIYPVDKWQKVASPVWSDINPSETLQYRSARENDDERHIAPLQLEVIRRGIDLWTNPGDIVFSPFGGIGSEPYIAVQMGRMGVAAELKDSYYGQLVRNMRSLVDQGSLFGEDASVLVPEEKPSRRRPPAGT